MKKAVVLGFVLLISACAKPKVPLDLFRDFTKQNATSWKDLNRDMRHQIYIGMKHEKIITAMLEDERLLKIRLYLLGEQTLEQYKQLYLMNAAIFTQTQRDFRVLLYALKRRGIKIDLDKENELLMKEQKKGKKKR